MQTGEVIRAAREALELTQKQLAERAGLDHSTVSRIECDAYEAPARTIKAITDALGEAKAERGAA
jgi:transcriptional regulator with XRE-family HTH domain